MCRFRREDNDVINTSLSKYSESGYCVINAITNLLRANGFNINIVDIQQKMKYYVNLVCENRDIFNTLVNEFYKDNEKKRIWLDGYNESEIRQFKHFENFLKFYRKNVDCMCGNADYMIYAVCKTMGYKIKWINRQLHASDLELLHARYGNFIYEISGHCSCFCNGEIVDFFNPFTKNVLNGLEVDCRKLVKFIIYR